MSNIKEAFALYVDGMADAYEKQVGKRTEASDAMRCVAQSIRDHMPELQTEVTPEAMRPVFERVLDLQETCSTDYILAEMVEAFVVPQIEVTPEMISAGASVLRANDPDDCFGYLTDRAEQVAEMVFAAMARARKKQATP